jgi:hypothetical protein
MHLFKHSRPELLDLTKICFPVEIAQNSIQPFINNIVTDLLSALLSNGSVNKPQQRDCFYVVREATVATQHRGKHISAAIGRHRTIRNA